MKTSRIGFFVFIFISFFVMPGVLSRVSAASDYLIFTKPLFDFVLPDAVPATGEITSTIKLSAAPDEYEPATFIVRATQKDLAGVTVTAGDLKKGARTIPKQHIDIRVVKVWKQGGLDKALDTPAGILVPELLLYNDAEKLTGGVKPDGSYVPPTISTTLRTSIPKDTSKQFWVTVYIPPATPAGTYTSILTISSGNASPQQITLEVTVLTIALKQPKQIYGLYYRPVDPLNNTAIVQQELADIRAHGFGAMVSNRYKDLQELSYVLGLTKNLGFTGPIIGGGAKIATSVGLLREFGYEPYLYGIDEPQIDDLETGKGLRYHIRRSYNVHKAGGKVMTAIVKSTSDALDNPASPVYDQIDPITGRTFRDKGITNEKLDMANYQAHGITYSSRGSGKPLWDYIEGLRKGTTSKLAKQEVYYWQIWVEKPLLNRMMAGFFLWTSKLDGIYPYVYQALLIEDTGDPFDDFDNAPDRKNRDNMTTYPSAQGPIPTTKWEALREGYDDVRYLTTFYDLLPALRAKNSQLATTLAQEIKTELVRYNDPKDNTKLSGSDFGKTRQLVIRSILAAQQAIGPTPTPTPTGSPTPTPSQGDTAGATYMWIGAGAKGTFSDEQIAQIGKRYDMVIITKSHAGWDRNKQTEEARRIKAVNPKTKVLFYWSAISLHIKLEDEYRAAGFKDEWILVDKNGKKIEDWSDPDGDGKKTFMGYFVDLANAQYRQWATQRIKNIMAMLPYDGVAFDGAHPIGLGTQKDKYEKLIGSEKILQWNAGLENLIAQSKAGNPGKVVVYNGIADKDWKENRNLKLLDYADYALNENFCLKGGGRLPKEEQIEDMELMKKLVLDKKGILQKTNHFNLFSGEEHLKNRRFCTGVFVLGWEPDYMRYVWGNRYGADQLEPDAFDVWQTQKQLVAPKSGSTYREAAKDVFTRTFVGGWVWVNMGSVDYTVTSPADAKVLLSSGGGSVFIRKGDTVKVTAGDALFLYNPMPGDLDGDGDVDIDDYNLLVTDFGKTGSSGFVPADIDKNGTVDIFDYNILVGNFGR